MNVECHELLNYAMVRSIGLNHYVYEHECELGLGKELGIDVLEDNWCVCYVDLSSPFLFVVGDDCVTYHTGANDIPSDDGIA